MCRDTEALATLRLTTVFKRNREQMCLESATELHSSHLRPADGPLANLGKPPKKLKGIKGNIVTVLLEASDKKQLSKQYKENNKHTLIFVSSGLIVFIFASPFRATLPILLFCRNVLMRPQRNALLLLTCSRLVFRSSANTAIASVTERPRIASKARPSKSPDDNIPARKLKISVGI